MPRRYRRRYYPIARSLKTNKYSNETLSAAIDHDMHDENTSKILLSPASTTFGTRKAKNFTLSIVTNSTVPFIFALIFVPEGTTPQSLTQGIQPDSSGNIVAASLFEPSQNIILSGICGGPSANAERFKTRLARNLNSGDRILLLLRNLAPVPDSGTTHVHAEVDVVLNCAISY